MTMDACRPPLPRCTSGPTRSFAPRHLQAGNQSGAPGVGTQHRSLARISGRGCQGRAWGIALGADDRNSINRIDGVQPRPLCGRWRRAGAWCRKRRAGRRFCEGSKYSGKDVRNPTARPLHGAMQAAGRHLPGLPSGGGRRVEAEYSFFRRRSRVFWLHSFPLFTDLRLLRAWLQDAGVGLGHISLRWSMVSQPKILSAHEINGSC
jgi:hypothetical protein